ncbi:uncharacterized protein SCHCODRAFT_02687401 [Schizophyllum commune H4-8]|nr:uncharacterized protein SCHCODRAFT_02687401 [Schizophyllum commune H4-8]KAI5893307.1 hypothetical protein SCHCODRAFT_02687401 [Schizophyllum commune H4-8]
MSSASAAAASNNDKKHVAFAPEDISAQRSTRKSTGAKRSSPASSYRPNAPRKVFGFLVTEDCMRAYYRLHPEDVYLPNWHPDPKKRASQIVAVKDMLEWDIPQACRERFPSLPQFKEIRIGVTDGRRYGSAVILADTISKDTASPPPPHVIEEVAKFIGQEGIEPEWFVVDVTAELWRVWVATSRALLQVP